MKPSRKSALKLRLRLLFTVLISLANPLWAKCPTYSVKVRGKIECFFEPEDKVLATLIFFDHQPESSGEISVDVQGAMFSGRVAFDTYSSSGFFHADKCHRRPKSLLVRLIRADGVEKDRTSLKMPADFFYDQERGEYTAKSDVTLHGQCQAPSVSFRNSWSKLDAGPFSISAPPGWEFHRLLGVDSYVGEFVGDGIALRFDFGQHSSGYLQDANKPAYLIARESIGGFSAKIVSPRTPGHGLTAVYFHSVGHSTGLCLWGKDLTSPQQELVLKIFETIRFGGAVPRYVIPPPPPPKHAS
jgi:hypothetical protein